MDQSHQGPPVPPPELVQEWVAEGAPWTSSRTTSAVPSQLRHLATQAARWGADQELEACLEWMAQRYGEESHAMGLLRTARRPKWTPRLSERALRILGSHGNLSPAEYDRIRRALESLPD